MAWRNLWRNKRRTMLSMAAIAFAVFAMVAMSALQEGAYSDMIDNSVKLQTGHLQIQHPEYLDDKDVNETVDGLAEVYETLDRTPGVVGAVGRIMTGMLVAQGEQSFGCLVMGTDAAREEKTSSLAHIVKSNGHGGFLDAADPNGVLIGEKLARNLFDDAFAQSQTAEQVGEALEGLIGREMVVLGQAVDGSTAAARVTVRGIFDSGSPDLDRSVLIMNLAVLQDLMFMDDRVNHVAVLLDSYKQMDLIKASLEASLKGGPSPVAVRTWEEVSPGIAQGIELDNVSGKFLIFLLLLVVAFGIMNTFLMSAFERVREFGVLMSIGVKPRTCAGTLIVESQMLMLVGFVIGLALGAAFSMYFGEVGLVIKGAEDLYEQYGMKNVIYTAFSLSLALRTMLQVWIVTFLVALYPAWKITRFRPVEALRHM